MGNIITLNPVDLNLKYLLEFNNWEIEIIGYLTNSKINTRARHSPGNNCFFFQPQ